VAVQDPETIALRDRVDATIDENVSEEEAFVSITLKNGKVVDKHIEHAIGSVQRPLSTEQLEHKFTDQAQSALPMSQIEDVMAMCWEIDGLDAISELSRAAAAD
jgi:2-methylcitrate dehydratase PrpD